MVSLPPPGSTRITIPTPTGQRTTEGSGYITVPTPPSRTPRTSVSVPLPPPKRVREGMRVETTPRVGMVQPVTAPIATQLRTPYPGLSVTNQRPAYQMKRYEGRSSPLHESDVR